MVPGNPVANMYGALYGGQPITQGINFLSDLKLGQYTKVAPRVTFCMQLGGQYIIYHECAQCSQLALGTIVGALLNCEFQILIAVGSGLTELL